MFEQPKISKKLKQQLSKVLSIALSVAMLAGTIPADMLGGIAGVKAEELPTTLSASSFTHDQDDNNINGTTVFKVESVTAKAKDLSGQADYFELNESSTIEFEVVDEDKTGTLTISYYSDESEEEEEDEDDGQLTLTKKPETLIENLESKLEKGSYELKVKNGTVKISSIQLTLNDVEGGGDGPVDVTLDVEVNDDESLLSDSDTFTFTPGENDLNATAETVNYNSSASMEVTLKAGVEYTLTCGNKEDVEVTAVVDSNGPGSDKVTVSSDDEGKTITITVTAKKTGEEGGGGTGSDESKTHTLVLDKDDLGDNKKGLKANENYDGGFSVLENMEYKEGTKTVEGKTYENFVQGNTNPSPNDGSAIPAGAVLKLSAQENGELTIATSTKGKKIYFLDVTENTNIKKMLDGKTFATGRVFKFPVEKEHDYYFFGNGTKVELCYVNVYYGDIELTDWEGIDAPEITDVSYNKGESNIIVKAKGLVGRTEAQHLRVDMKDSETDEVIQSQWNSEDNSKPLEEKTLEFIPEASGKYTFTAYLERYDKTDKEGTPYSPEVEFSLPLTAPVITTAEYGEDELLTIKWQAVKEADSYTIKVTKDDTAKTEVFTADVADLESAKDGDNAFKYTTTEEQAEKLENGETYLVTVTAKRGESDSGPESEAESITIGAVEEAQDYYEVDLTKGLVTSGSYAGGSLTVLSDMPYGSSNSATVGDVKYDGAVQAPSDNGDGNGGVPTKGAIKFVAAKNGKITIVVGKASGKKFYFIDADNDNENIYAETLEADMKYTVDVIKEHTYYIYVQGSKMKTYAITIDYRAAAKADWGSIAAPVITSVTWPTPGESGEDKNTITVKAKGAVGMNSETSISYADELRVDMLDEAGEVVASESRDTNNADPANLKDITVTFKPTASVTYTFKAYLVRAGEDDKECEEPKTVDFILPLVAPKINTITNKGSGTGPDSDKKYGSVEVTWDAVAEASNYLLTVTEKGDTSAASDEEVEPIEINGKATSTLVSENLEVGKTYVFSLRAKRAATEEGKEDEITTADTKEEEITGMNNIAWEFRRYGASTDTANNNYGETAYDEEGNLTGVRVWSKAGKGKIVPNSTDGIAFYFTDINPNDYNFVLSANLHVNEWTLSNGQDGFGLLASDRVGKDENGGDFWTNSYMAVATKVEYFWDSENNKVSNGGDKVELKLGLESLERTGVTADNVAEFENKDTVSAATNQYFKSKSKPLDTQVHDGTYNNLIGNATNAATMSSINPPITDLQFKIELNATGYFISYTPISVGADGKVTVTGETVTNKYYDRDALSKIITDKVYVGFFASRNADITFSDISLTTTPYDAEETPESRPIEYVDPKYTVSSAKTANSEDYTLIYETNWKGTIIIKDESGKELKRAEVSGVDAATKRDMPSPDVSGKAEVDVKLNIGNNNFIITFNPYSGDYNSDTGKYDPTDDDPITRLSNYDSYTENFTVTYKKYGETGNSLYVAPMGSALGTGTKKNPVDIYTAVKYVQPGQTIYLMEGTYNLSTTVRIDRGIDGTEEAPIYMIPDPDAKSRPVFDFHGACAGMVLAGNYWYFKGFDVTRSKDAQKGIQVSGDYNTLDSINTYKNGNTGIQISRLLNADVYEDWPHDNLILNCTSYLNADAGYEDADGFACKLTTGDNNVFDGCVAAYNADDGWDLYAKVETGSIGDVTIKNCVAYKNGYVLREVKADGTYGGLAWFNETAEVAEVAAGNGNGFKMGGSSLSGKHVLRNSLAFYNRAKGFDSNSGSDIKVYDSITFDNESYNVAFYSSATKTDFAANGVISYRRVGDLILDLKKSDGTPYQEDATTAMEDRIGTKTSTTESSILTSQKDTLGNIFNGSNYFWNHLSVVSEIDTDFQNNYTKWVDSKNNPTASTNIVSDDWFEDLEFDNWLEKVKGIDSPDVAIIRNADGTINMGDFLKLSAKGKEHSSNGGLGTSDPSKEEFPPTTETKGNIDSGNASDETSNGPTSEDLEQKPGGANDIVGLWISIVDKDEIGYTGKAVKPEVRVFDGNTLLTKKDYSVSYKNNINAYVEELSGTVDAYKEAKQKKKVPTIVIRGKGNYINNSQINTDITFDIQPVSITDDEYADDMNRIGANDIVIITDKGGSQKITPVLTFNGKKLSRNKDITYNDVSGTPEFITVTGTGNFIGTRDIKIRYTTNAEYKEKSVSKFKVAKIENQYRQGYADIINGVGGEPLPVEPEVKVTSPSVKQYVGGDDYDDCQYVVTYRNNIEIGTATAVITGINGYYGTKEVKFRIIAPPLNTLYRQGYAKFVNVKALEEAGALNNATGVIEGTPSDYQFAATYAYTGKAVEKEYMTDLGVAVKRNNGDGESWYLLEEGKDYKLTPRNTNKAGSASIVVKGIGNYSSSMASKNFKITPFELDKTDNADKLGGTFAMTTALDEEGNATKSAPVMFESYSGNGQYNNLKATVSYDKSGSKPTISLRVNGNLMTQGKDYTVTYKNNRKPADSNTPAKKMPTVVITGRNGLKGKITATFTISSKAIDDAENQIKVVAQDVGISTKSKSVIGGYEGKYTTRIVVKDSNGKALSAGKDYNKDITYEIVDNNTLKSLTDEDGNTTPHILQKNEKVTIKNEQDYLTVKVTVTPTDGGFYDSKMVTTEIKTDDDGNPVQATDDEGNPKFEDDGVTPVYETVEKKQDRAIYGYYRIAYAKNNIKSAKATIDYTKSADFPGTNKFFYYSVDKAITLDDKTLTVEVKGADGKYATLKWGTDFEVVEYKGNTKKGTASLTIQGKGKYIGTKVIKYKIGAQIFAWWK